VQAFFDRFPNGKFENLKVVVLGDIGTFEWDFVKKSPEGSALSSGLPHPAAVGLFGDGVPPGDTPPGASRPLSGSRVTPSNVGGARIWLTQEARAAIACPEPCPY